ncbi:MAG: hypothetical protein AB7Y46_13680 [Armatimonadota bacterium]
MQTEAFVTWASQIRTLMEGNVERLVVQAIDELIEAEQYELLSHLMLTGSEISVRRMTDALIKREVFEPLVAGACMRREVKRAVPVGGAGLGGGRIFRDIEAPAEGEAAIPEHILEEAEAISQHASQARRIAAQREARLDRDPVRQHIVDRLAELLNTSEAAMEAMIAIARASVWEETARAAAMKLGSNKIVVGRISRAGRVDDMIAVGDGAGSEAVRQIIARSLAEALPDVSHPSYRAALEYIEQHHPSEAHRRAAAQALGR